MKIPNQLGFIVVNFINGSQESYIPISKVDEYEDSYEFNVDSQVVDKNKMVVIFKNSIRDINFVSK